MKNVNLVEMLKNGVKEFENVKIGGKEIEFDEDFFDLIIEDVKFKNCVFEFLFIDSGNIKNVEFLNCKIKNIGGDNIEFENIKLIKCKIKNSNFDDCKIKKVYSLKNKIDNIYINC